MRRSGGSRRVGAGRLFAQALHPQHAVRVAEPGQAAQSPPLPIFDAIEQEDFEQPPPLCTERFEARQSYWLYAPHALAPNCCCGWAAAQARTLFEAVIAARALPLGQAGRGARRSSQARQRRPSPPCRSLLGEDAPFADAYDVLGRAQVELGQFAEAIETYRTASELTPDPVVRLQSW